eukprot:2438970-Rhodomonas_salina.1
MVVVPGLAWVRWSAWHVDWFAKHLRSSFFVSSGREDMKLQHGAGSSAYPSHSHHGRNSFRLLRTVNTRVTVWLMLSLVLLLVLLVLLVLILGIPTRSALKFAKPRPVRGTSKPPCPTLRPRG